ncbi:glycerol kinase GlpK [Riemerella anatipestifer]|uniref:glycerol kinase GlpK n=1 Tax=Riemerella anatipestifer TaxID=34085 RepID=UPI00129E5795|nr:glycerol kinase GlpK [Riemerella anatipestifer]MBT0552064.1 glycerol kinase GlpK [Riemerella anatipestifer]MBT0554349.1 glycerol kinase GlpK [Riemerella anatipestifer]MCE3024872.1 glycerol kinase GlpK [Riemerella anatipestifer]MCU7543036.1 glycerol kinase GlpK [Riemerella anatipestifer]MCU7560605.1 glycerol kinase GlpK [Riemerella anatipestifer]
MKDKLILALDQGTTSSRAILFNHNGEIVKISQKPFEQIFPKPGWVEHNANEIWSSQISVAAEVIAQAGITGREVAAIGITNQRETTIVWDRETGEPIYNAIVWQDRRTSKYCDQLKEQGHAEMIKEKTGLVLDAYFSGTKLKWILDNVEGAREKAKQGKLCFGTVDTWLVFKLTRGKMFITDVSNASRTLLFNIRDMKWDDELLALFDIPKEILPEVKQSSEVYGETSTTLFSTKIPIAGIAGDQQAALFGQMCTEPGMVKNTYGTGCFLLMNTGDKAVMSKNNLLTTVAWKINGQTTYALEGSVFVGGAAIQWIRDGLMLVRTAPAINSLAETVEDNGGVYFVPALTGLGAPYWDQYARGGILGITRGTTDGHIARATLEGIAYQVYDIVKAMEADAGEKSKELRVDGGATASNLLMQIQADLFGFKIIRPKTLETTALGAAYLAGLAVGYWDSIDDIKSQWIVDREFEPKMEREKADKMLHYWHKAVKRVQNWEED